MFLLIKFLMINVVIVFFLAYLLMWRPSKYTLHHDICILPFTFAGPTVWNSHTDMQSATSSCPYFRQCTSSCKRRHAASSATIGDTLVNRTRPEVRHYRYMALKAATRTVLDITVGVSSNGQCFVCCQKYPVSGGFRKLDLD